MTVTARTAEWECTRCGSTNRKLVPSTRDEATDRCVTCHAKHRIEPGGVPGEAQADGLVVGVKYYPAGATTHSDAGVTRLERTFAVLERMQERGMVLQVHGEVTDSDVDVFDRERVFIDRHLAEIVRRFPRLKVVLEHVTTREGVQFVLQQGPQVLPC